MKYNNTGFYKFLYNEKIVREQIINIYVYDDYHLVLNLTTEPDVIIYTEEVKEYYKKWFLNKVKKYV